jgi:hypothetical protein
MDNLDIRQNILLFINDNKLLSQLCLVDKLFYKILSNKTFWNLKFERPVFDIGKISYDKPIQWIILYEREKQFIIYTDRLMEILEHPTLDDFVDVGGYIDDPSILIVFPNEIDLPKIFNVEDINLNEITEFHNKCLLDSIYKLTRSCGHGYCNIYIEKEKYIVRTQYQKNLNNDDLITNIYNISKNSMRKIFYNMLLCGTLPRDNYAGEYVRLVI